MLVGSSTIGLSSSLTHSMNGKLKLPPAIKMTSITRCFSVFQKNDRTNTYSLGLVISIFGGYMVKSHIPIKIVNANTANARFRLQTVGGDSFNFINKVTQIKRLCIQNS